MSLIYHWSDQFWGEPRYHCECKHFFVNCLYICCIISLQMASVDVFLFMHLPNYCPPWYNYWWWPYSNIWFHDQNEDISTLTRKHVKSYYSQNEALFVSWQAGPKWLQRAVEGLLILIADWNSLLWLLHVNKIEVAWFFTFL